MTSGRGDNNDSVGARIRRARKAKNLSQAELGALVGRSESWLEKIENGRLALEKFSLIDRLAEVLAIDVAWLLGQPYHPGEPAHNAGHSEVPTLRTALRRTSLILSGHPRIHAVGVPQSLSALRNSVNRVTRRRQAANLLEVMLALPELVEALNTRALDTAGTPQRDVVYGLIVETGHIARMALNQLGYHDLAWTAVENAAIGAAIVDDPLLKACSAWDRCGVLLHTGSPSEVFTVAEAAMNDLADLLKAPTPQVLSLYGALNLRCAVAASRRHDAGTAAQHLDEAQRVAARLGVDRNDFQTVFGPGNVAIHATEIAVELDQPDIALARKGRFDLAAVPSKERHTSHYIDLARAYSQLSQDAVAVATLRQAAAIAPHYVYNHPLARGLVEHLLRRAQPTAFDAGLAGLERAMGLG
ncbi:helix-turn-helix domain-containing protein [Nocardia sp. NPDC051052]|uniref:helix-turn-helix domain-containing protein n=1 Tax=Nocardia sp. NPDC051052 TaxID=3364322 RepID=UPI003795FDA9